MKIRPTGGGAPRIQSVTTGQTRPAAVRPKRGEAGAVAPDRAAAVEAAGRVAASLRAGQIGPKDAISLLVDATLDRLQGASPALRKRMRQELVRIAGEDPGLLDALERARKSR